MPRRGARPLYDHQDRCPVAVCPLDKSTAGSLVRSLMPKSQYHGRRDNAGRRRMDGALNHLGSPRRSYRADCIKHPLKQERRSQDTAKLNFSRFATS